MIVRIASVVLALLVSVVPCVAQAPTPPDIRLGTIPDRIQIESDVLNVHTPFTAPPPGIGLVGVATYGPLEQVVRNAGFDPTPESFRVYTSPDQTSQSLEFVTETPEGRVTVRAAFDSTDKHLIIYFTKIFERRADVPGGFLPPALIPFRLSATRTVVPQAPSVIEQLDDAPAPTPAPPAGTPTTMVTPAPQFSPVSTTDWLRFGGFGGGAAVNNFPLTLTRNLEVVSGQIGGATLPEERNTTPPDPQDISMRIVTAHVPRIAASLPGTRRNAGGGIVFSHTLTGSFGVVQGDLTFSDLASGTIGDTRWSGSGLEWGAEYGVGVSPCGGECPLLVTSMFSISRFRLAGMRSDPIDLGGGVTTSRPEADLRSSRSALTFALGVHRPIVSLEGGVRLERRGAELIGGATVSGTPELPVNLSLRFENELEQSTTAIVMFGARVGLGDRYRLRVSGGKGLKAGTTQLAFGLERSF